MLVPLILLLLCGGVLGAEDDPAASCYSGGSITGAVLGTVVAIFLLQAALYFLWNLYWKGKSGQHLVLVTDPEKGESIFAFDNPGFKEGPSILPNGEKENHNMKVKWTQWSSSAVASTPNSKGKSMDDTYITSPPLTRVPLRGHDFTGLGFNICGNMRDGIFVKDVLHRGPASESGRIMPGDRIDSIKINFRHMVFEDALTIMSYASPYEVELAVESRTLGSLTLRTPPPPHRISHPVYRSQSISDIHKICKPNIRRVGDQQSSMVSDVSGGETKFSTIDRKPKPADAERTLNTRNCTTEGVQRQENTFHEVELSRVEVDETDSRREAPSPGNVKSRLVKGIQNLKEKLHQSLHQDEGKEEARGSVIVNVGAQDCKGPADEGFQTVDLSVPEEVERAGQSARNRRSTIEQDCDGSDGEDPVAAVRSKRKAPRAPEDGPRQAADSESEDDRRSGTTIELDSSHVTVHQAPESDRKASSLGDLSRYEAENATPLERAVSLDLADGAPSNKKRKAPLPPAESCPFKEARVEGGAGTLKKSSVWGTLEDVIADGSDSSDADLGISGCSTPERSDLVTSTPFKFLADENGVSNVRIEDYKWDGSLPDATRFITALNGDDTPPELPTSPMPKMSTFVTEIRVSSIKPDGENEVIHLDDAQQLFDHVNSHKLDLESSDDLSMEDGTASMGSPESSPEPTIVDQMKKDAREADVTETRVDDGFKISRIHEETNGSAERSDKSGPVVVGNGDVRDSNMEGLQKEEVGRKEDRKTEGSRGRVTITNIKTSPSRIPVRAGPRSPAARANGQRNGHTSP